MLYLILFTSISSLANRPPRRRRDDDLYCNVVASTSHYQQCCIRINVVADGDSSLHILFFACSYPIEAPPLTDAAHDTMMAMVSRCSRQCLQPAYNIGTATHGDVQKALNLTTDRPQPIDKLRPEVASYVNHMTSVSPAALAYDLRNQNGSLCITTTDIFNTDSHMLWGPAVRTWTATRLETIVDRVARPILMKELYVAKGLPAFSNLRGAPHRQLSSSNCHGISNRVINDHPTIQPAQN